IRTYINFVWRHWLFIVSVAALVLLIGVIYLARATPLYTAAAQVLLEKPEKSPTDTSYDYYRYDYSFIDNQLAIIRSDAVLGKVALKERLAVPGSADVTSADDDSVRGAINSLRGALAVKRT